MSFVLIFNYFLPDARRRFLLDCLALFSSIVRSRNEKEFMKPDIKSGMKKVFVKSGMKVFI